jgi:hypothetical protein
MGFLSTLALRLAPGLTQGIPVEHWLRLLWDNGFRVQPKYWPKAIRATIMTTGNTPLRALEELIYGRRVAATEVLPPLFVLGHWRSGTTLLQNLLAVDDRFASPTWYQVFHPHHFLLTESIGSRLGALLHPPAARGLDNVLFHTAAPAEEEFALSRATFLSPALTWTFPRRAAHYDRYLSFRGVPEHEVRRWQAAFVKLARKLTFKFRRPLIFKSPHNTCRIRILLEIFPAARFVHIHRDPYTVYKSTRKMNLFAHERFPFQDFDLRLLHGRILRQYREMYDAYFEERSLIGAGRLCEVAFEDLESDPLRQIRRVYEELSLPDFEVTRPAIEEYVRSLAGYRKNEHPEMSPEVRADVARHWRRCFDEWHYPLEETVLAGTN